MHSFIHSIISLSIQSFGLHNYIYHIEMNISQVALSLVEGGKDNKQQQIKTQVSPICKIE